MHMKPPVDHHARVAMRNPPPARQAGRDLAKRSGPNIDLVKFLRDNVGWLILGLLLGLGVGYLQFTQSPAMFRSSAKVQIIESSVSNLPVESLEGGMKTRSLSDETLVMRSERILIHAAELADLSNLPEFDGMTAQQIGGRLSGSKALVVEPAVETNDTTVFLIQYDSTGPETSQRVVQALIDAYESHLQDQYRNVGLETIALIQSARKDVLEKLTGLENDFAAFKKESGLVYRENAMTNVHHENADNYLKQKQSLLIEHAHLSSVLSATKSAIADGQPTEAVLVGLTISSVSPELHESPQQIADQQRDKEILRIRQTLPVPASERMRQEKLLPLQLERHELARGVGQDHPALATIDQRIRIVEGTIKQVERSEKEMQQKLDDAWRDENGAADLDPEQQLRDRLKVAVGALLQQLQSVSEEVKIVGKAYEAEIEIAKTENVKEMRSAQFVREIARQQELYHRIMERLEEVNLMDSGAELKVFPLSTAKPGYQFAPSLLKSLLMGGFLGCLVVGGLAFLREVSDRSFHSAGEIAEHVRLPVIGHVPFMRPRGAENSDPYRGLDPRLCTALKRKGFAAEAFRAIRTAVFFSDQSGDHQVLQVTSAAPGDGKSVISANLAITIAQSGRSVLLVDADMRRHRVHKLFGMESERGLAWAINQIDESLGEPDHRDSVEMAYREAILETRIPNLSVMLSTGRCENPAELLSSCAFERLLESLRKKFDMIIIDTPPLLAVSDPSNVVRRADAVVLVARLHKRAKPVLARAARILETLEAKVLGVVVNGVGSRESGDYGRSRDADGLPIHGKCYTFGYGYSYGDVGDGLGSEYYGDEDDVPRKRRTRRKRKATAPMS